MILIQEIVMTMLSIPLQASSVVVCSKERVLICGPHNVADLFSVSLMFCDPHKKVKGIVLSLKRCRVCITPHTPFHCMTGGALGVPSCVISISRWPDVHFYQHPITSSANISCLF